VKIALAADHAGVDLKDKVAEILTSKGHEVVDFGTNSKDSVDYPDFGLKAARAVASGEADRAIAVCMTGNGMNITVNKVKGIRAGLVLNTEMAYYTRLHNDANMMTLSQRYTDPTQIEEIIDAFLTTEFEGGRHLRRVDKITEAEKA
jgi:ribose 5-phosphate isomerase B